jgi:hypothetical protein
MPTIDDLLALADGLARSPQASPTFDSELGYPLTLQQDRRNYEFDLELSVVDVVALG